MHSLVLLRFDMPNVLSKLRPSKPSSHIFISSLIDESSQSSEYFPITGWFTPLILLWERNISLIGGCLFLKVACSLVVKLGAEYLLKSSCLPWLRNHPNQVDTFQFPIMEWFTPPILLRERNISLIAGSMFFACWIDCCMFFGRFGGWRMIFYFSCTKFAIFGARRRTGNLISIVASSSFNLLWFLFTTIHPVYTMENSGHPAAVDVTTTNAYVVSDSSTVEAQPILKVKMFWTSRDVNG